MTHLSNEEVMVLDPTGFNAGVEAAAKAVETHYLNPASLVSPQQSCAMAIRALKRPTPSPTEGTSVSDEYHHRTRGRLIEILSAQDQNPRSWQQEAAAMLRTAPATSAPATGPLKLDTDKQVFFYEQDFYVLSNFSAFRVKWRGHDFDTSEHAYHWEKFNCKSGEAVRFEIEHARSAHDAFKIAEQRKELRHRNWDAIKVDRMRDILRAKADQHEYVRRKLLATGDLELVENSWRDDFWGWGPNRDGQNMLGKLWMEVRDELRK